MLKMSAWGKGSGVGGLLVNVPRKVPPILCVAAGVRDDGAIVFVHLRMVASRSRLVFPVVAAAADWTDGGRCPWSEAQGELSLGDALGAGRRQVWDLGGQTSIRPYWRCYYPNTDAIVFVVDSSDRERMSIAKQELMAMLEVRACCRTSSSRESLPAHRATRVPIPSRMPVPVSLAEIVIPRVGCRLIASWSSSPCLCSRCGFVGCVGVTLRAAESK